MDGVEAAGETRWFVLLEPSTVPEAWRQMAGELLSLGAATVDGHPHITVASATSAATDETVAGALHRFAGKAVTVGVEARPSYREGAALHFKWTIGLPVAKDEALRLWVDAALRALRECGLETQWTWDTVSPHVTVARGSAARPSLGEEERVRALEVVTKRAAALRLTLTTVKVTRLRDRKFALVAAKSL